MLTKDGKVIPNRVWFSLTGNCNNKCVWCYRKGSEVKKTLSEELIFNRVDVLAQCGTRKATIIGGEPTLHKNYPMILKRVTEKMSSCSFVTNGRILSENSFLDGFKNDKAHFIVSLHGANSTHYKENTGVGSGFLEAVYSIKNLSANEIRHSVNVVVGNENLPFIPEFIEVVSNAKANMLCFTIAIPSVDDEGSKVDPVYISSQVKNIHNLCEKKGLKHLFIFSLPWCLLDPMFLDHLISNGNLMFNCPVDSGNGIVIKETGAILVCTHLSSYEVANPEQAEKIFASKETFMNFWNSPEINNFRKSVNVYRHPDCQFCIYRLNCKGGCPLWWQFFDFKPLIKKIRR
jgi:radical SAM protein with 4Fe4S-binding SPASM domain